MEQVQNKIESIFLQETNTMSLFRDNFELEKKTGGYMKLQKGENKLRILSQFIGGWEEWDESRKPIRYRERPETIRQGLKQFAAAIVWNYQEGKIQILEITQASIIRQLQALSDDKDWGPVFFYDVKIIRTGEDMLTKYQVNPLPAKPLDPDIKKAFYEKRINLDALYKGDDPFGQWPHYTEGVFEDEAKTISEDQAKELDKMIGDDEMFRQKFRDKLVKAFGSNKFTDIPKDQYELVRKVVVDHNKARLDAEMRMTA